MNDSRFFEFLFFHQVSEELASVDEVHHQVNCRLTLKRVMQLDKVWTSIIRQYFLFVKDFLFHIGFEDKVFPHFLHSVVLLV